ncbi:bacillithiol system redox-active protein YtxJ [Sporosarcina sp. CAU 1771]
MKELQSIEEWNNVLEESKKGPLLVLKHSTTCPISTGAYDRVEAYETEMPKYFLTVQDSRPVSNEMAEKLDVEHQSPQLFIINNGEQVWNASHTVILASEINRGLAENNLA